VEEKNTDELNKLEGDATIFKIRYGNYTRKFSSKYADNVEPQIYKLLKTLNLINGEKLDEENVKHPELKIGAQVMLCTNLDVSMGLVNGSRGIIIDFALREDGEEETAFKKNKEEHILYTTEKLPIVRFANGKVIEIPYVRYTQTTDGIEAYAWRIAIKLAWATSIHKSQSLTLDAVEADLSKCFDAGMAYVALSRVKSLENLRLSQPLRASTFQVDKDVLDFYAKPFALHKVEKCADLKKSPVKKQEDIGELLDSEEDIWEAQQSM
jgi:hypothetical protein